MLRLVDNAHPPPAEHTENSVTSNACRELRFRARLVRLAAEVGEMLPQKIARRARLQKPVVRIDLSEQRLDLLSQVPIVTAALLELREAFSGGQLEDLLE